MNQAINPVTGIRLTPTLPILELNHTGINLLLGKTLLCLYPTIDKDAGYDAIVNLEINVQKTN